MFSWKNLTEVARLAKSITLTGKARQHVVRVLMGKKDVSQNEQCMRRRADKQ